MDPSNLFSGFAKAEVLPGRGDSRGASFVGDFASRQVVVESVKPELSSDGPVRPALSPRMLSTLKISSYVNGYGTVGSLLQWVNPPKFAESKLFEVLGQEPLNIKAFNRFLNTEGVDLNGRNEKRDTLLHVAIRKNRTECVKKLLEKGALPLGMTTENFMNTPGTLADLGLSPLGYAVELGHADILGQFLDVVGEPVVRQLAWHSIKERNGKLLSNLLHAGLDPNLKVSSEFGDHKLVSLVQMVHETGRSKWSEGAGILARAGAEQTVECSAGMSFYKEYTLLRAAKDGNYDTFVRLFAVFKEDIRRMLGAERILWDVVGFYTGNDPEKLQQKFEMIEMLEDIGMSIKDECPQASVDRTVLSRACMTGPYRLVHALLERGASGQVNVASRKGVTPLHLAAFSGETEIMSDLINRGAQLSVCMPVALYQGSPLECAVLGDGLKPLKHLVENFGGHEKHIQTTLNLLLEKLGSYDYVDSSVAEIEGMAKYLLQNGALLDKCDEEVLRDVQTKHGAVYDRLCLVHPVVLSLKSMTRRVIRQSCPSLEKIAQLPLPTFLKEYLAIPQGNNGDETDEAAQ